MALKNDKYSKSDQDEIIVEQWAKAVEMADTTIDKRINSSNVYMSIEVAIIAVKYSLQGTTQGRYLTGGVPPVRFSM